MTTPRSCLALAVLLASVASFASFASAQTAKTNQVVGWVSSSLLPASGAIQTQDVDGSCKAAVRTCTNVLLNTTVPEAGGTAYDPRRGSVWVSDGNAMGEWALASCKNICSVKPSIMRKGAVVAGLAISNRRRMLFHLESMGSYLGILPWNNSKCPPVPTKGGCFLTLGKSQSSGGLAYDEARDLFYFTISSRSSSGYANTLHVSRYGNACKSLAKFDLPSCPKTGALGMVSGIAFDSHKQRLHLTDGTKTMTLSVTDPLKGAFKLLSCCDKQTGGGIYKGPGGGAWLVRHQGWQQHASRRDARSARRLDIRTFGGDPAAGNQDFGVLVENGPSGSLGVLAVGLGACTKGFPFLCGRLYFPPTPFILVVGKLTGSQCAATLRYPLPVPSDIAAVGNTVCMQWLVVCSGVSGGLTPALQVRIDR